MVFNVTEKPSVYLLLLQDLIRAIAIRLKVVRLLVCAYTLIAREGMK